MDNKSKLTTDKILRATMQENSNPSIDFAGDQRRKVSEWAQGNKRSKNGTQISQNADSFKSFLK